MYTQQAPSVAQVFNEGYMSGEDLINFPDIFESIFPFMQEEKTIVDFMIASGRKKKTDQSTFNWHEEDVLIPMAQIKSKVGTIGAGNPVTITIYAINADNEVPFKKWDVIRIGGINGWIESDADITVDAGTGEHSFVVKPVNNTKDIVTATVADAYAVWVTAAKADGTAQPKSMFAKPIPYSGQTQIIPTNYTTNGSAAANKAFVQTKSGNKLFYYRGVEQAVLRHKMAIVYALLIGQESVGLQDTQHEDGATTVRTTSGLDERMRNDGNTGSNTAFTFDELQNKINKKLDELYSPEEYFALVGNQLKYQVDNILFDRNITNATANYGAFATLDYTMKSKDAAKAHAVNYNFDSAKLGARTYHFRQEKALYYNQITGASGLNFPLTGYFLPADQIRDPKSGEWYNSMCVRFKESDRENRFTTEWVRDYKSDDVDKFRFNHRSEIGWMQARVRQTYLWEQS